MRIMYERACICPYISFINFVHMDVKIDNTVPEKLIPNNMQMLYEIRIETKIQYSFN